MTPLLPAAALLAAVLGACGGGAVDPPAREASSTGRLRVDTLSSGRFGPVVLYRMRAHPARVVLFVSGDGGWNQDVVAMARSLASLDALVAGVDIRRYRAALAGSGGSRADAAADFESLSQAVQRRLGFPAYVPPVLAGYSSGATLVYATLVQAPPGTFLAGVSLGFCPDLRPTGALSFAAVDTIRTPWVVLQGEQDSSCGALQAERFVRRVRGAELVRLPGVGHGFGVEARWLPQFRSVFERVGDVHAASAPAAPAVRDLPLVELPAHGASGVLAVILSGDGGWASIDRKLGETFAARGIPVVGLNSLQYFWHARTPDEAGRDLARVLRHYLATWKQRDVLLVGYSLGADVLPFMASRLPPDLRAHIRLVALLGAGQKASFEFHLGEWIGAGKDGRPTVPEIERLRGLAVLCVYGTDEKESVCPLLPAGVATVVPVKGGHHLGGAYSSIADRILRAGRGR